MKQLLTLLFILLAFTGRGQKTDTWPAPDSADIKWHQRYRAQHSGQDVYIIASGDYDLLTNGYTTPTDTIPVIMLVSDTSGIDAVYANGYTMDTAYKVDGTISCLKCMPVTQYKTRKVYEGTTWTLRGYEVGYSDHSPDNNGIDLVQTTYLIWHHLEYLDEKKKPITNYVWQSKQLK